MYCPATRAFQVRVVDNTNQEIICIKRCSHEIIVESPLGTVIGSVAQQCSFSRVLYALKDATDNVVLKIVGPGCLCDGPYTCCCEDKFILLGNDGVSEIGSIHKKYRGFIAGALTSADSFTINVPMDLDVRMKAVALDAVFLINCTHFAEPNRRRARQY
ncbi:unnamed protein product [Rotaria magnacalcarata]|uniref:Phospholipid scramblase n=1 Tax=Rotaria magnacalcarata TaxID=392030 RepID=A0A816MK37_9BILA|nr:unnamed protein product [Rotaria magnacalcarata]CAF3830113.1 unnamed protein product [Rotaria magnacalcarata]CAF4120334.1 unnamed protein product [Rotaria magnacalcarata]